MGGENNLLLLIISIFIGWHHQAIFLEGMHRFKDDPEWGRILGRIRAGQDTEADRKKINERFLGLEEVELPDGGDVCYAVFKNNERNSISAGVFNDLIQSTHPSLSFHLAICICYVHLVLSSSKYHLPEQKPILPPCRCPAFSTPLLRVSS